MVLWCTVCGCLGSPVLFSLPLLFHLYLDNATAAADADITDATAAATADDQSFGGRKEGERARERRCLAPPAASLVKLRLPAASVCLSEYKSTCQIGCTHSLASLRLERSTASVVSTYSFTNSNLRDLLCTFFHFNSCFLFFAILFCSVVCHLWFDLSSLIFVVCSIATSCCCRSSLFRDATQHRLPFHSSFPLRSLCDSQPKWSVCVCG